MRLATGACRINGLHIMEVSINGVRTMPKKEHQGGIPELNATYAVLEGTPGSIAEGTNDTVLNTHGKCTATIHNWSQETLDLLNQLLDSMEQDLLPRHFNEGNSAEANNAWFEPGTDETSKQV